MKYTIEEVMIAGFRSYRDPTAVRFKPGINVIVGPNGSGKSNLLKAITWILGGISTLKETKSDLVPDGTQELPEGHLTLRSDSGQLIIVSRTGSSACVQVDGVLVAKSDTGVNSFMLNHFNLSKDTIKASKYVRQGGLGDLTDADATTRIRSVELIQGTAGLNKVPDKIKSRISEIQDTLNLKTLTNLTELQTLLDDREERLKALRAREQEVGRSLHTAREVFENLKRKKGPIDQAFSRNEELKKLLGFYDTILSKDAIPKPLKPFDPKDLDDLNIQICAEADHGQLFSANIDSLNKAIQSAKDAIDVINSRKMLLAAVSEPPYRKPEASFVTAKSTEHRALREKLATARYEYEQMSGMVDSLDRDGESCSRCGSQITEAHRKHIQQKIEECTESLKDLAFLVEAKDKELEEIARRIDDWNQYEQRVRENETASEFNFQLELQATKLSDMIASDQKELAATLELEIQSNEKLAELHKKRDVLQNLERAWARYNAYFSENTKTLELKNKDQQEFESLQARKIEENYFRMTAKFKTAQEDFLKLDGAHRNLCDSIEETEGQIKRISLDMEKSKRAHETEQNKLAEIEVLKQTHAKVKEFLPWYQSLTVPLVRGLLDPIMETVGGNEFSQFDLSSDFEISAMRNGHWQKLSQFSFAQRDTAGFALRVALSQLQEISATDVLSVMLMDEPTGSFDSRRVEAFRDVLGRIRNVLDQLIIVTHDPNLAEGADNAVRISLGERGSKCQQ